MDRIDIEKEADDVVAPIEGSRNRSLLGFTAIATILAALLFSWYIGLIGISGTQGASSGNTSDSAPAPDLKIKGNKRSRIYHLPGCPNYEDIAERNIRWFRTHEEAKAAGFRMARNC